MSRGLRAIFALLLRHRTRVLVGLVCLLGVDAGQLAIPLVVRRVIDAVTSGATTRPWIGEQALIILALTVGIAVFRFAWRHFFFSASRLAETELRQQVLDHALSLSAREFTTTRTGEVMALAMNDVETVRQALAMGFVAGFDASAYALVAVAAMFWLDPLLTSFVILPLPFLALAMTLSLKAVYKRWDAVQDSFERMTEKVRESIAGIRVLKAYAQRERDSRDFDTYNEDYFRRFAHYVRVDAVFHPVILVMAGVSIAILLAVGGGRVIRGQTSIGTFVALTSYLGMLTWPMIAAGWMLTLIQRATASMDRINEFLSRKPQVASSLGPVRLPTRAPSRRPSASPSRLRASGHGPLRVEALTFTYPGNDQPALKDLSFRLPVDGSLGIVGEIGSGKSTVAQLLCRIYEPPPGCIFLGNEDVARMPLAGLRETIAYVPQEAFLFSDTIAENLRLGNPGATLAEMEAACRLAAVHDEIMRFPKAYDTLLGERGITLSGGQKQRLCLARALLKDAPTLVLDDTLSAVDADVERRILAALRDVVRNRATIIVSHRVSAVRDLDHILVLKQGEVIQQGRHDELADRPGYYREMMVLQEMETMEA